MLTRTPLALLLLVGGCAVIDALQGNPVEAPVDAGAMADGPPPPFQERIDVDLPCASSVATGDLDGDALADLVIGPGCSDGTGDVVGVMRGADLPVVTTLVPGFAGYAVAVADVDGDGRGDIVASRAFHVNIALQLPPTPTDAGTELAFAAPIMVPLASGPGRFAIGDLDQDGQADLAVTLYSAQQVQVLFQDPGGGAAFTSAPVSFSAQNPNNVAIADVDADGANDLVFTEDQLGYVDVVRQVKASPGTFAAPDVINIGIAEWGPRYVAAADLNDDGAVDLAIAAGWVYVALGSTTSPGTFLATTNYRDLPWTEQLAIGDVSGEGRPDLVVQLRDGEFGQAGARVMFQGPAGASFDSITRLHTPANVSEVALGDLNGDGRADVSTVGGDVPVTTISVVSLFLTR